jgi:HK97 family phage prohead protease
MKKLIEYKQLEKQFNFSIKSVDKEKNTVDGVFSTQDIDRQDEVIMQSGWDLTNYKNNPVVLYAHDYHDFPIAKMTEIGTEPNTRMPGTSQLIGKMQFAVNENPKAKIAFDLMVGGFLSAFSVGFKNNRWEVDEANDTVYLNENELLEVSVVPVPANQMALAKAKGIDTDMFEARKEKNEEITAEKAIAVLLKSQETIQAAIKTLTEALKPAQADNQDGKKVEHPLKKGGTKKISVRQLNSAIRELLKAKKTINSK